MIDYNDINSIPNLVETFMMNHMLMHCQIPTLFMSKFAKPEVGVVLSGDGGMNFLVDITDMFGHLKF